MSTFACGGVIRGASRGDDLIPALLSRGCVYMTGREAELLAGRIAAAANKPARLMKPLPRRVRAGLAAQGAVDTVGIWLSGHGHPEAARRLWRLP